MNAKRLQPWKTISRHKILEHSRFLTVESHAVQLPTGEIIEDWPWIVVPDAAIIVAKMSEEKYFCFRQTKYAVEGTSLALVAGMVEPGEDPLETAKRELLEEAGCISDRWSRLGSYVVDPNRFVGKVDLFLAQDAQQVAEPDSDDLEEQEPLLLSRKELEAALKAGEFKVLSWAACVALALDSEPMTE